MSEQLTEERTCRFPGCRRPAMAGDGTGRPPEYCDDPKHNRAAAWRARQRLGEDEARAEEARPVDAARQRASEISGQVSGMIEHLGQQLAALVDELRTVGDPGAAEAQIESISTEAAEKTAAANARATRAEQAQRRAEAEKAEADAAAQEATQQAGELTETLAALEEELTAARRTGEELAQARAAAEQDRAQAEAAANGLRAELEVARAQLVRTEQERDTAADRAEASGREKADAENRAATEAERAQRAEAAASDARAQLDAVRADLDRVRETAADLRGSVATLTAERDAARADTARERAHGDQRVEDLRTTYERQTDQLHAEAAQARAAATATRPARRGGTAGTAEEGTDR